VLENSGYCTVIDPEQPLKIIDSHSRANVAVLLKPQFETGKRHKGVITDKKLQDSIAVDIANFARESGFVVVGIEDSPIVGKSGNREFLMGLKL